MSVYPFGKLLKAGKLVCSAKIHQKIHGALTNAQMAKGSELHPANASRVRHAAGLTTIIVTAPKIRPNVQLATRTARQNTNSRKIPRNVMTFEKPEYSRLILTHSHAEIMGLYDCNHTATACAKPLLLRIRQERDRLFTSVSARVIFDASTMLRREVVST